MSKIKVYCKNKKIMRVFLQNENSDLTNEEIKKEGLTKCDDMAILLEGYLEGKNIDLSQYIDLNSLNITDFEKKVYLETINIPKGQVRTYKEIGDSIGTKGYRAVGNALNKNPIAIVVPCHRVVGSNMKLTGFRGGLDMKKSMLEKEGIKIKNDKLIK
ncbi:methylated-DNA--protein-cysteine methyltransferase [Methanobrevibacter cuticularis]|uniref:methylated-DNA--[protein]-cysteine S-methyltransferase n=1 Tax=Methanobrevibacter cuticularis TaxID=47311 RepID=A0A166DDU9_9EURY|nr:MGMT family protein [Methanobrevibacter cuticularis]KZX15486.1 methylated-DNA--protein-cysteine methyltransferase [Methanobrevibacter cuticularis]